MEGDVIPENSFVIEEIAGYISEGIPMTEDQAYHLHNIVDPEVDRLIANIELEKTRRKLSDEYQKRTIPSLNDP